MFELLTLLIAPILLKMVKFAAFPILGKHCANDGSKGSKKKGNKIPLNHLKVIFFMCFVFNYIKMDSDYLSLGNRLSSLTLSKVVHYVPINL
jgi:hypothetical protein